MKEIEFQQPRVSIIILNWNRWRDTLECMNSILKIDYLNYDILLLDNGSTDESIIKIHEWAIDKKIGFKELSYPKYYLNDDFYSLGVKSLIFIKNDANYGFAKGNNIGIEFSLNKLDPKYILLLNNDVVVDPQFLIKLIEVAEQDKRIGLVGPKIYYYNFKGRDDIINFAGGKLNMWLGKAWHNGYNEADKGNYDKNNRVDFVEGSCLLIKKEVLATTGLLNEDYFAYWEEVDLCVRALKKGYLSYYVPESKIWHKISQTALNEVKSYYLFRNRILFMRCHARDIQFLIFLVYMITIETPIIVTHELMKNKMDLSLFLRIIAGIRDGLTNK